MADGLRSPSTVRNFNSMVHPCEDHGSTSNPPCTPSGSRQLPKSTEAQPHSYRSCGSWVYYSPKVVCICLALVLSAYFQITGDPPLRLHKYWTDNPYNNGESRGYTCGCELPASMQNLEYNNRRAAESEFNLNVCYDPSAMQDMNILMFSNSSAEQIESILKSSVDTTRMAAGYKVEQQAHAIDGPLDTYVEYEESDGVSGIGYRTLYPGEDRQMTATESLGYFRSAQFTSFPPDYLRIAFKYCSPSNCSVNSTLCGLKAINQAFDQVLSTRTEKWGGCFLVEPSECNQTQMPSSYQGMCTIYRTATIPSSFAVRTLLERLLRPSDTNAHNPLVNNQTQWNITAPKPWHIHWGSGSKNNDIALQPSIVYVNHSKVTPSPVLLHFKQVDPQSAPWLDLAGYFHSLDSPCSNLSKATVCNGGSICSSYMNGGSLNVRCLDPSILSNASFCEKVFYRSTLQNADGLCKDLGVTPTYPNNSQCACRDQSCKAVPPYLATWNTSKYLENDPLNAFLYSGRLKHDWAGQSGLCTNKHGLVIPYNPGENSTAEKSTFGPQTILLNGNCSLRSGISGKATGSSASPYCWLTGEYRNFTDVDNAEWKRLNPIPQFRNDTSLGGRFVCYKISGQRTFVWFIVVLGVVFGWAGSVDLIFHFLKWFKERFDGCIGVTKEPKASKEKTSKV